jgi:5-methylcytosine-specific restriction enzyme B
VIEDDVLTFKQVDGVIKQMAAAMRGSAASHLLIVDELNRANVPRVFGELMYLLEYRDEAIDLQYSRDFQLPKGLKMIATMNTADRSIRSIDVALRRRFEIFECRASAHALSAYYESSGSSDIPGLVDGFTSLNSALTELIDRHHTVGQSFFMEPEFSAPDLRRVWQRQIAPLLEDYFFDQPDVVATLTLEQFWPNL